MNLVPIILTIFMQIGFSACSIKDQAALESKIAEQGVGTLHPDSDFPVTVDVPVEIDSDGDFLTDKQEIKLGLDPFTATMPRMIITQVNEVEAGGRVKRVVSGAEESEALILKKRYEQPIDIESTLGMVRNKILKLQYITTVNPEYIPNEEELADATDDDLFIVGNWKDTDYFPFKEKLQSEYEVVEQTGRITSTFKVGFKNIKYVDEVTKAFFSTNLVNIPFTEISEYRTHPLITSDTTHEHFFFKDLEEFRSFDNYSITDILLDTAPVFEYLSKRYSVGLKVKNFQFKRFGAWVDYSVLKSNVAKKTSKIVFSTPEVTRIFNVTPRGTLKEFLDSILNEVSIDDDSNIIRLEGYTNTLSTPVDLEKIPHSELDKGYWILLANAKSINIKLMAGKQYIISYATAGELLRSQSFKKQIVTNGKIDSFSESGYKVSNLKSGDRLEIHFTAQRQEPLTKEAISSHRCYYSEWEMDCDDYGGCRTTRGNSWKQCKTVRRVRSGYGQSAPLKLDLSKIRIFIGGGEYGLLDITDKNNPPVIYSDGYKLSLSVKLQDHILKENTVFFIKLLPSLKENPFDLGYLRYHSPKNIQSNYGGRAITKYPTDVTSTKLHYKDTLSINILRTGINR